MFITNHKVIKDGEMTEYQNTRLNELAEKVLNEKFSDTDLLEYKALLDMWNETVQTRYSFFARQPVQYSIE